MTRSPSKKKPIEWWAETLEHISQTWKRKKGRAYMFNGQDLKMLKQLRGWFTAPETMALWSVYLSSSPFYGPKSGYLVGGLYMERSILLDNPDFKRLTKKYEADLGMKEPKHVTMELGL